MPLSLDIRENVAVIHWDSKENRFNLEAVNRWNHLLDEVLRHDEVQALVTTGHGKFYSNGADLAGMQDAHAHKLFWGPFNKLLLRMLTFPIVTVAAINGHCFAGGMFFALAHDYRVMVSGRGWMSCNEVHIGLRFMPAQLELLKTKLPQGLLQTEVLVLGRRFTGDEAKTAGLVQQVFSNTADIADNAVTFVGDILPKPAGFGRDILHEMKKDVYVNVLAAMDASKL